MTGQPYAADPTGFPRTDHLHDIAQVRSTSERQVIVSLGNTYMDVAGHKNVTEELADLCLSPNGRLFTAGYAETWGGGAEYNAEDGGFIARYDGFDSGFGDPVKCVAAAAEFVFWGTRRVREIMQPPDSRSEAVHPLYLSKRF